MHPSHRQEIMKIVIKKNNYEKITSLYLQIYFHNSAPRRACTPILNIMRMPAFNLGHALMHLDLVCLNAILKMLSYI